MTIAVNNESKNANVFFILGSSLKLWHQPIQRLFVTLRIAIRLSFRLTIIFNASIMLVNSCISVISVSTYIFEHLFK